MQALIGEKKSQTQKFLENGTRIPVTLINVEGNRVIAIKTAEKDHYQAIQLGFSMRKHGNNAILGHVKGAGLERAPKFLREVRIYDDSPLPSVGDVISPSDVFQPGDIVNVTGTSKGKGYAGVVKRYGFRGGPKTHGQSDRHRAPGSIGQGTTPGRVYKGKRMAGRMGSDRVTLRNLLVVDVNEGALLVKGLIPGVIDNLIYIEKVGEHKKFVPLWKDPEEVVAEPTEETSESQETAPVEEAAEEKQAEETKPEEEEAPVEESAPAEEEKTEEASETKEEEEVNEDAK